MTARIPAFRGAVRALSRGVAVVALTLTLAGCAATQSPAPTAAPDPKRTAAYSAAEATYRGYLDALNAVDLADPATFDSVLNYTTDGFGRAEVDALERIRDDGSTLSGEAVVTRVDPVQITSDFEGVTIAVCTDVSAITLTGPGGESVVPEGRPDVQSLTVDVVVAPDSPTGYRITNTAATEQTPPC